MEKLPVDVLKVKEILLRDPSNNLYAIAQKLVVDSPELVGMWQTLEKKNRFYKKGITSTLSNDLLASCEKAIQRCEIKKKYI